MVRKGLLALAAVAALGLAFGATSAKAGGCHADYDDYHHGRYHHHHHHHYAYRRHAYYGYGDYGYGGPVVIRSFYGSRYAPYHGHYGRGYGYHSGYGCGRGGVSFSIGF